MDDRCPRDRCGVAFASPSYKGVVSGYVMGGESLTFVEFMSQIRTVQVEPIAGEIIDGEGIFDIQVINVFQTLIAVF